MSTDSPSSSAECQPNDYALRRDLMREWAADLDQLAVLQDELTKSRAELEWTRCENIAQNSAIEVLRRDTEVYKEEIATQRSELQKLQNNVDRETYRQLLENYWTVQAELDKTKIELDRQTTAFAELQRQKDEEQMAHMNRLRAEILSIFAQAPAGFNAAPTPAGGTVQGRPQVSPQLAPTSSNTTRPQPESITRPLPHCANTSSLITTGNGPRTENISGVKPPIKGEHEDDIIIVESSGPKHAKYLTALPEGRRKELEESPEFVTDVDKSTVFTRGFLSATLGGSHQPLIVKIAKQKQKSLAESCNIEKFLVPNQNQNPWCPRFPGEHGYMFVGLGNERETFQEPERLNLFLSVPTGGSKALEVTYMGFYEVSSGCTTQRRRVAHTITHRATQLRGDHGQQGK
ncbi:Acetyltransferase component of pyruvate dehydrogenase complex [Mycena sanguinolenta]|uniref:Acetyltransferase component of pyruvate dehydrogenase complex n=1 Tax=Mycena sanguinolenta TaxID=230812 RepID=A0A8H6XE10_9AGAR|nr:Acetyltransferase component of pyruvate dehydrogenase complex [Mycena sanguinolenta]